MYNNHKDLLIFVELDHIRVPPNAMLVLPNVTMEPLNVRKKKKSLNVRKVQSYVMLVLYNVRIKLSNLDILVTFFILFFIIGYFGNLV